MSARFQNRLLRPLESMSLTNNQGADHSLSPVPDSQCIFMRGIRIGLGRTEWVENVEERPEAATPYTEFFFDYPRLPFLKIRLWGKDEQTPYLNEKSHFSRHAFHPSDIVAQIMLCMFSDDEDEPSIVLVEDSIWAIASQAGRFL
ncbi:hypothetical protein M413DRAFT_25057 [Hebeloma cylindrosporum]|uniref:Uncharacterized protein n=1 Tax=Hebeloma cylindrosporum TaxID=76867 RepID=A0A0C3CKI3_HEBCY|nr:hypothetical protein M413DRAFT_25057 [Hebeloma cylindrosporum h7]